jgi:hypothetical protein
LASYTFNIFTLITFLGKKFRFNKTKVMIMSNSVQEGSNPNDNSNADSNVEATTGIVQSPVTTLTTVTEQVWTTADFLEAEPCPVLEVSEEDLNKQLEELTQKPESEAGGGVAPGGLPQTATAAPTGEQPTATTGGYNYPPPYSRFENFSPYNLFPFITIGKLFFEQGGGKYVCSAASIGNNAIWTAGHCVHRGNGKPDGWSTRIVFVPAYKDGTAPFGQWPAKYAITTGDWYGKGNPGGLFRDMGGAVLFPNSAGKKISEVVGWLGFAWNWSYYQHWMACGYPAGAFPSGYNSPPSFNGQRQIITAASFAYTGDVPGDPKPQGIGSDMTGGCSGGPWILRFGRGNYLNGNNSYRHGDKPEELFSPRFDDLAKSVLDVLIKGT